MGFFFNCWKKSQVKIRSLQWHEWFGIKLAEGHDKWISKLFIRDRDKKRNNWAQTWFPFKCVSYIYLGAVLTLKKIHSTLNPQLLHSLFIDLLNYRAQTAPSCLSGIMLRDKLLISGKLKRASICPPSFLMCNQGSEAVRKAPLHLHDSWQPLQPACAPGAARRAAPLEAAHLRAGQGQAGGDALPRRSPRSSGCSLGLSLDVNKASKIWRTCAQRPNGL